MSGFKFPPVGTGQGCGSLVLGRTPGWPLRVGCTDQDKIPSLSLSSWVPSGGGADEVQDATVLCTGQSKDSRSCPQWPCQALPLAWEWGWDQLRALLEGCGEGGLELAGGRPSSSLSEGICHFNDVIFLAWLPSVVAQGDSCLLKLGGSSAGSRRGMHGSQIPHLRGGTRCSPGPIFQLHLS